MNPRYIFIPAIVCDLMDIEAARQTVRLTTLPPAVAERLCQQARVRSTHYSTPVEGNRPTAWLTDGGLEVADPARKSCRYRLSARKAYRRFIGGISAK